MSLCRLGMSRETVCLLYENWLMDLWKKNAFERYLTLLDEYPEVI